MNLVVYYKELHFRDMSVHNDITEENMERILNIFMRGILGTIAIYFINSMLESMGISLGVGVNAFTVLTSGILGFPGVLALYVIGIYKVL